jgi:hypothetical protein
VADTPQSKKASEEVLEIAKERFRLVSDAENDIRALALEDLNFRAGEQWHAQDKKDRQQDRRPCLTINRLPQFIRQITNDQRQNRPAIKVHPVDDKADPETAKIFQGLIRHIEYNSGADVAYDTAFDGAVTHGRGFFRILTDYVDPFSFEQEALIKAIRNPFMVYMDPSAVEPDGSDAKWAFIVEDLTKEEYEHQFKGREVASLEEFASLGDQAKYWVPGGNVRIAEYFYKEFKEIELCLVEGQVVERSQLPEGFPEEQIQSKRKAQVPVIKWCKLSALEIIEEREWVGKWIPIIPVYGEVLDVDGKIILEGVVRHAKDSQRMYNYWASAETETIALAPKAPYIGYEGQFEGHEAEWENANRKNYAYLEVKPVSLNGQPAPLPQRQAFEAPVQAITGARMQAAEDLKATTGIYDAALGNRSNESSGIAIQRRANQAQTSNFHFVDNLSRSIRHAGRILVDILPKIYDTARAARIVGEDGQQEIVRINEMFGKPGQEKAYMLGVGKYDVVMETGPSYATKRQEAVASMLEFTKIYPEGGQAVGDLLVRNMDWPGATEIADRLKKLLPPNLLDDKDKPPMPPEAQAQLQQLDQQNQMLTEQLNKAIDEKEQKTIELESKERIEMAKIQANIEIEMAKMGSKEGLALLAHEVQEIQARLSQLNYDAPFPTEEETAPPIQEGGLAEALPTEEPAGGLMPEQWNEPQ